MARKGARVVLEPGDGQDGPRDFQDRERGGGQDREPWKPEVWVRDPDPETERAATRAARGPGSAADGRQRSFGAGRTKDTRSTLRSETSGRTRSNDIRATSGTDTSGAARSNDSRSAGDGHASGARQPAGRRPAETGSRPTSGRTGTPTRTTAATAAARQERRLAEAAKAYEADRYADTRRLLRPLLVAGDPAPEVRELNGLTLYRMGRWSDAIAELKAFAAQTGSYDQHPVLADCHRALKRWKAVDQLWEEIRQASSSPEVVAEGRIVAAGALADRGDISGALKLLERAPSNVKRPALHHLRLWYAQADLYERAGEIPRARELFRTILRHDPSFVDAAERLTALA